MTISAFISASKLLIVCTIVFTLSIINSHAQAPKAEIRAVWVATVANLDWPTGSNRYDIEQQKSLMKSILDTALALNLNAIFFQIRPKADALYQSSYTPWSEVLTGARGNDPGYDPLAFTIEEAHKRGIEIHGWLNPYRFETSIDQYAGKPGDYNTTHPEWMLTFPTQRILNPGIPEVQEHMKDIVGEIINNYDVDGIHFDDYFYPYSVNSIDDIDTYNTHKGDFTDIGDWRRYNVNHMISLVNDTIQSIKPYVRFGISPFGIYGNNENPEGISGLDAYNTIYTDPKEWLSSGSIDYINPQLYWTTGGAQDFNKLAPYWAQMAKDNNRHMIAGHGLYKLSDNPNASRLAVVDIHENKQYFDWGNSSSRKLADGWTLEQITQQINIVRNNRDIGAVGSVYFRYQDFFRVDGIYEEIKNKSNTSPALMPSMPWKGKAAPMAPVNLRWKEDDNGVFYVTWDEVGEDMRYVLYASEDQFPEEGFLNNPANIVKVLYDNTYYYYVEVEAKMQGKPNLFITSYDRYGNESTEAASFSIQAPTTAGIPSFPANGASGVASFSNFEWSSAANAQYYRIEFSETDSFDEILFEKNVNSTTVNITQFDLRGDTKYFWRIRSGNFFGFGALSDVFSFTTGYPDKAKVIYPVANQEFVDLKPLISWEENALTGGVRLQIARGGNQFETFNVILDEELGAVNEYQLSADLNDGTTHHMRVQLFNDFGQRDWEYVTFKTLKKLPQAPAITAPTDGLGWSDEIALSFMWNKSDLASGYKAILSRDKDRTVIVEEKDFFSGNDLLWDYGTLDIGTYYFSIAGKNIGGLGEWSQVEFEVIEVLSAKSSLPEIKAWAFYDESRRIKISVEAEAKSLQIAFYDLTGKRIYLQTNQYTEGGLQIIYIDRNALKGLAVAMISISGQAQALKIKGSL